MNLESNDGSKLNKAIVEAGKRLEIIGERKSSQTLCELFEFVADGKGRCYIGKTVNESDCVNCYSCSEYQDKMGRTSP